MICFKYFKKRAKTSAIWKNLKGISKISCKISIRCLPCCFKNKPPAICTLDNQRMKFCTALFRIINTKLIFSIGIKP